MTCETCRIHSASWVATKRGETWLVCTSCKKTGEEYHLGIRYGPYDPAVHEAIETDPSGPATEFDRTLLAPVLPYRDPVPNSGHSGTDTSRDRALARDANGQTVTVQARLLELVTYAGAHGLTVDEARTRLTQDHHGTISGALSNLHRDRLIARLTEKRNGCKVYVHPSCVRGRYTEMQGRLKKTGV